MITLTALNPGWLPRIAASPHNQPDPASPLQNILFETHTPSSNLFICQQFFRRLERARNCRAQAAAGLNRGTWCLTECPLASFCSKTVKRAVVAGENAQSRQSVFRWRRTAPFQKVIYMRPESLLSRRAETCRHTSCMAVKQGVSEESGEVRMQPCWCGAYFALLLAAE